MALQETGTITSVGDLLLAIAAFAAANGWTVNETSATVTDITKGGAGFRLTYADSASINVYATEGGSNSWTINFAYLYAGYTYRLYACGTSMYLERNHNRTVLGLMHVEDKIGDWTGGTLISSGLSGSRDDNFLNGGMWRLSSAFYYNGSWHNASDYTKSAGEPWGSRGSDPIVCDPNNYNLALVPIPILIAVYDANTNYIHPMGYAPGVYRCGAGSIYSNDDVVTIGGEDYAVNANMALLFKLSN